MEWNFQKFMEILQIQRALAYVLHFLVQLPTRNFLITDQSKLTEAAQVVPWLASMAETKSFGGEQVIGNYSCNRLGYAVNIVLDCS